MCAMVSQLGEEAKVSAKCWAIIPRDISVKLHVMYRGNLNTLEGMITYLYVNNMLG